MIPHLKSQYLMVGYNLMLKLGTPFFLKKISWALFADRFTSLEVAKSMPDDRLLSNATFLALTQMYLQLSFGLGNHCNHDTGDFYIDTPQTIRFSTELLNFIFFLNEHVILHALLF